MLDISSLCKGFFIGLTVAAAIGPIALLCIHRTIAHGFKAGFSVGLGAAVADSFYGIIAGAGLITLSSFLIRYEKPISILGSAFLLWLAVKTLLSYRGDKADVEMPKTFSTWKLFFSSFLLTLSSPFTILMFTAIFTSFGMRDLSAEYAVSLVLGVFLGSSAWWLILSGGIGMARARISDEILAGINQMSGLALFGFAGFMLVRHI